MGVTANHTFLEQVGHPPAFKPRAPFRQADKVCGSAQVALDNNVEPLLATLFKGKHGRRVGHGPDRCLEIRSLYVPIIHGWALLVDNPASALEA